MSTIRIDSTEHERLLAAAADRDRLDALVNNPQTDDFMTAVRAEMAHQVERWGEAHDRGKSAENWFWLVGYLAGKALRAAIVGDTAKALHHCVSSAAAAGNWFKAVKADKTGAGIGHDDDIRPIEIARFEGNAPTEKVCGNCDTKLSDGGCGGLFVDEAPCLWRPPGVAL